ncbi:MAG: VWA domain-containing protein [Saprospiraceae bacterium]|nr:VWA domain-containing protein [Saprospiraceae bacterium]MDZ4702643.1 VWA domain-containing protein [Saprospiraceae bacterium]
MRWLHPEFLYLFLLLPVAVFWYWLRYRKRYPTFRLSSLQAVRAGGSWRGRLQVVLPMLRIFAFAALIMALARPQEPLQEEKVKGEGIDIMLSMDLSSSMLAMDFKPNRLEVSKRVASEFVGKRTFDRVGIVVFAGEAFTQCPLTTDHRIVKEFLSRLECGNLEDGTAIGMGLATAVNRLKDTKAKSKVIILLTDGVNNTGYQSPQLAAKIAKEFSIKIYTIGIGASGEAQTPVSRRSDGTYIFGLARVEMDEPLMREIAQLTGGQYYRATTEQELEQIYAQIDQLEKSEIEITSYKRYGELFRWFVLCAVVLVFMEFLLRHTVLRTIP